MDPQTQMTAPLEGTATLSENAHDQNTQSNGAASRPFGEGAVHYVGWTGIIPIQRRTKVPFPGFTGRDGVQPSYEQSVQAAASDRRYAVCNLALRLPLGMIGLDVDAYDDKPGAQTLERLEKDLGRLPDTWRSGSRMPEDPVSGIRLYRVPEDLEFDGVAGPGIDIVQHHHRTVMAWPSVHPKSGRMYRWATPTGVVCERPPFPDEIPELPEAWVQHLACGSSGGTHQVGDGTPVGDFLDGFTGTDNPRLFDTVGARFRKAVGSGAARHDSMLKALGTAMRDAARGYYPAAVAESRLREMWDGATSGEGRDQEYDNLLQRAVADVNVGAEQFKRALYEEVNGERSAKDTDANRFTDAYMAQTAADEALADTFCWTRGAGWFRWNERTWSRCDESAAVDEIRRFVVGQVEAAAQRAKELQPGAMSDLGGWTKLLSAGRLRAVTGLSKAIVTVEDTELDADPDLLNCANGVLDLRSGVLMDHDPAFLMTKCTGTEYRPGYRHADWDAALMALPDDVLPWYQDRIGQGATGYMTPDDLMVIAHGDGANGKSTIASAIQSVLGTYAVLLSDRVLMASPDAHPTELMDLQGARYAVMEETPEARRLDVHRLKKTVGTETITARRIRQDDVTFQATHSLFVNTNFRPVVVETDHGTWRRLAMVGFPYTFRKRAEDVVRDTDRLGDPTLRDRCRTDPDVAVAVLSWIVDGARRWYARGKTMMPLPDRVERDTFEWRADTDLIMGFARETLAFGNTERASARDLLATFNRWAEGQGHKPWTDKTFSGRFGAHDLVKGHGVEKRRVRPVGAGKAVSPEVTWIGVTVRDGGDPFDSTWNSDETGATSATDNTGQTEGVHGVHARSDPPKFEVPRGVTGAACTPCTPEVSEVSAQNGHLPVTSDEEQNGQVDLNGTAETSTNGGPGPEPGPVSPSVTTKPFEFNFYTD